MKDAPITGSKLGITVGVMCAALMAVLDISVVNVALSDIRASFGTPLDRIGWVSIGYMMANVVIIPLTGFMQRRFGYRRYFTGSIILFTGASILCGVSWDLPSLVVFRVLQGIGGGAIIPTSQAILFARYPQEEHSMAGALFGLGAITGPLLGPTVGGYLIEAASWHWIFLINVPFGLLAAGLTWRHIDERRSASLRALDEPGYRPRRESLDLAGMALLAVGMASLQYVLEEGNRDGWWDSRTIVLLSTVAAVCLVTFVVHELETDHPVVDLRVFRNVSYCAGSGINFLFGIALFSSAYVFSLYCGAVMHYAAKDIGLLFLTAGTTQVVVIPLLGRLGPRMDGRYLVGLGIVVISLSMWSNGHLTADASFWDLARPQMVRAAGMGLVFIPLSVIALSNLPAEQRGNAAGLFNLTRELGGSIGTAWMGTVLDRHGRVYASYLGEQVSLYSQVANEQLGLIRHGLAARLSGATEGGLLIMQMRIAMQALIRAFNDAFLLISGVFLCGLLLALLLRQADPAIKVDGAH